MECYGYILEYRFDWLDEKIIVGESNRKFDIVLFGFLFLIYV